MPAHETTFGSRKPTANDQRFTSRMRAFEVTVRRINGSVCSITSIARDSAASVANAALIFPDTMGVKVKTLV